MPYFTYTRTRLNLYLYLLPVNGFQHLMALWKAYNNRKQIAQLLQRNCAQTPLKGICTFSVFLEYTLGLNIFANISAHLNLQLDQGPFKSVCNFFEIFFLINRFCNKYLGFLKIFHFSLQLQHGLTLNCP